MKVICLRHGEYSNKTKSLTEDGQAEASAGAERLKTVLVRSNGVVVMTSPLPRSRETADIIAKALACDVVVSEDLNEYPRSRTPGFWRGIASSSCDLVIITHFWTVKYGLSNMGRELGLEWEQYKNPPSVGGWIVDLEDKMFFDF